MECKFVAEQKVACILVGNWRAANPVADLPAALPERGKIYTVAFVTVSPGDCPFIGLKEFPNQWIIEAHRFRPVQDKLTQTDISVFTPLLEWTGPWGAPKLEPVKAPELEPVT